MEPRTGLKLPTASSRDLAKATCVFPPREALPTCAAASLSSILSS
jgi:hypothetical protein